MEKHRQGGTASIGVKPVTEIGLDKPVAEMDDAERDAAKAKVIEALEAQQAEGNKNMLTILTESDEFPGEVKMRRPSLDEERQIGIRAAKYLQGQLGVDVKTENLAVFFATFDVCCDWSSAPEWFKPREMHDYRLLEFIYGRFATWLTTFRKFVPPEPKGDSESAKGEGEVVDSEPIQSPSNG